MVRDDVEYVDDAVLFCDLKIKEFDEIPDLDRNYK